MGKSVVKVKNISAFCHYFELIHEWLYLTKEYEKYICELRKQMIMRKVF